MDLTDQVTALLTKVRQEGYDEGYLAGRRFERDEIREWMAQTPLEASPRRRPRRAAAAAPAPVTTGGGVIKEAMLTLLPEQPDGVFAESIAGHLKISTRVVRDAMRELIMTGEARRVGRGRFLPSEQPAEAAE